MQQKQKQKRLTYLYMKISYLKTLLNRNSNKTKESGKTKIRISKIEINYIEQD